MQVYLGIYRPDIVGFILFISIIVGICSLLCAVTMRELPPPLPETAASSAAIQKRFAVGCKYTSNLAAYRSV